jgi:hypothetical protein
VYVNAWEGKIVLNDPLIKHAEGQYPKAGQNKLNNDIPSVTPVLNFAGLPDLKTELKKPPALLPGPIGLIPLYSNQKQ